MNTHDHQAEPYAVVPSNVFIPEAESQGFIVIKPKPNELFIDIDSDRGMQTFQDILPKLGPQWVVMGDPKVTQSPSGKPWRKHIVVRLSEPVSPSARIILQAALGSDPMRELKSLICLEQGDPFPTLFKEKK